MFVKILLKLHLKFFSFYYFNVATRKFWIAYVAHIIFPLGSADLEGHSHHGHYLFRHIAYLLTLHQL